MAYKEDLQKVVSSYVKLSEKATRLAQLVAESNEYSDNEGGDIFEARIALRDAENEVKSVEENYESRLWN